MTRKRQRRFFPLLAVVLAAAVLAGCGSAASGQSGASVAQSAPAATPEPTPTPNPGLSWPYVVEDGNLQVDSLFQYSGINPDCDGEMGDDIEGRKAYISEHADFNKEDSFMDKVSV